MFKVFFCTSIFNSILRLEEREVVGHWTSDAAGDGGRCAIDQPGLHQPPAHYWPPPPPPPPPPCFLKKKGKNEKIMSQTPLCHIRRYTA